MNFDEFSASTCRVCLQQGAIYPLFDDTHTDILDKLRICLIEKLEDVEGYPRNICSNCKITLDMLCDFIETYKRSCKLLRKSLTIVKTEVDCDCLCGDDYTDNSYDKLDNEIEIKIENIKDLVTVNNTVKENNNDASLILKKLKPVPGLQITKIGSKKRLKENIFKRNKITKEAASGRITKTKNKLKTKIIRQIEEKTQAEIEDGLKKCKKKMQETQLQMKQEKSVLCDYCGAIFDKKEKLTSHIQSQHVDTKVKCTICSKEYSSTQRLRQHNKRYHGEKTLQCEYCNTMFADRGVLNNHVKSVHKKHLLPKKFYNCQYCNKIYKASQACVAHERTVHTGLKPDVCTVCGKAFAHYNYLRQHMRLHTGEQPFKCPICERGYSQLCNMKSHLRQHKRSELNDTMMPKMRPSLLKFLKNC